MKFIFIMLGMIVMPLLSVAAEEGFHATLRPGDTAEVTATPDSYYRLPGTNVFRLEPEGKNVTITVIQDYLFIDSGEHSARTKETLVINDHNLNVLLDSGSKGVSIYPDDAAAIILRRYPEAQLFEGELRVEGDDLAYIVPSYLRARFLWVFPFTKKADVVVNAETGALSHEPFPWYVST
ncbi:MAG: hypothetical protein ABIH34_07835 [Nanoarchaeota archaeon]